MIRVMFNQQNSQKHSHIINRNWTTNEWLDDFQNIITSMETLFEKQLQKPKAKKMKNQADEMMSFQVPYHLRLTPYFRNSKTVVNHQTRYKTL